MSYQVSWHKDYLRLVAPHKATHMLFWLHGLGASCTDFIELPQLLAQSGINQAIDVVLPIAPKAQVTANGGLVMPSWYDIVAFKASAPVDQRGIVQSCQKLAGWVDQAVQAGIKPENIVIAGFSQGAVIALLTALIHVPLVAGVVVASGYLPCPDVWQDQLIAPKTLPIVWTYGQQDEIVGPQRSKDSHQALHDWGYRVEVGADNVGHTVSGKQWSVIMSWLAKRLA
jgi:phospholipase/carboxylesterase